MFIRTVGSYPKVMENIGDQRKSRRSIYNFKKKRGNRVGGKEECPCFFNRPLIHLVRLKSYLQRQLLHWPPIVPPWTDTNLYRLYAWKNICMIKSTWTNLTSKAESRSSYNTTIKPCIFCSMAQVGKLWKGQPAGEENNDTPLHTASRAGNKVEWPHFRSPPRGQPRRKQGGMTSLPVPSTWPAAQETRWNDLISCPIHVASRQETRWNDLISCPIHVASRQENQVEWPHFLSYPRG